LGILEGHIENYIDEVTGLLSGDVGKLQQWAYDNSFPVVPKQTARFISTLLAAVKPKNILEIGCCIGFSAGLMTGFLAEGGHITTIDRYDIMIDIAKKNISDYGWADKITLLEGDAAKILPDIDKSFDFIFMDAAKGQYLQFLPYCIKMLRPGGILLADDILKDGYLAMDRFEVPRRMRTTHRRMREFVYVLTHTDGLETSLLTIGDGLTMTTKTKENIILNTDGFVY